jgi:hypothetical protein
VFQSTLVFFPEDEFHGLQAGIPLSRLLKEVIAVPRTRQVNLLAHSLGNIVVNSALLQDGMNGVIDTYVMNEAAIAAEVFSVNYSYSPVEVETFFPHGIDYGYSGDQRWQMEWEDMLAGRPPRRDREGFEFPDFSDVTRWHRNLEEKGNPALFPKPKYDLRWRQVRPRTGVPRSGASGSPERGPWRGFFASNIERTIIYNTYNATDFLLYLAWPTSVRAQKPNFGPLGILADNRATQFWALLPNTGPEEEYLWNFGGTHSNMTRQWAELAHWFPPLSLAAGQAFHANLRNWDFSPWGGVSPALSHGYMTGRPLPDVWGAYEALQTIFSE